VEKLGGGTAGVQELFDGLLLRKREAEETYIEQDYPACVSQMEAVLEEMGVVSEAALRAKDSAFIWIYAIEWLTVTATVFLSGYFLYYVMIGRRLYRGVRSTRTG
jgi:hypothetical protein